MRMRELAEASGLPRTTIHHYLREGLLPAARKAARNAAEYGPEHIERLALIAALRSDELGPFSLQAVRGILAYVDRGIEPGVAVGLFRALGAPSRSRSRASLSSEELAHQAGVETRRLREWVAAGLLVPSRRSGGGESFDDADLEMARVYAGLFGATGLSPSDLAPVATMIREAAAYEGALAALARQGIEPAEGLRRARLVADTLDGMYRYLHAREREGSQEPLGSLSR